MKKSTIDHLCDLRARISERQVPTVDATRMLIDVLLEEGDVPDLVAEKQATKVRLVEQDRMPVDAVSQQSLLRRDQVVDQDSAAILVLIKRMGYGP